jgi:hypothetical protein
MFDLRSIEMMRLENRKICDGDEQGLSGLKVVQFKPSLMDRVLLTIGEAMIVVGLKLKERPHMKLNSEQAQSPNYLIML